MSTGKPQTPRVSLRSNFAWNLVGNSLYNLAQWFLIVGLARLADPTVVGEFTLLLAISAPVFLTIGLNLRTMQVTDARRDYRLEEFFYLRRWLNLLAATLTILIGVVAGIRGSELVALAALCLAKSIETYSQSFYGYFQMRERLDLVSQSLIARSVTGPAFFLLGFALTHQLPGACIGLALGWLIPQWLLDRPRIARLARGEGRPIGSRDSVRREVIPRLVRKAVPLGLDQGVSSVSINIPRYAAQAMLGSAQLGVYASQAYLAQVVTLVTGAMGGVLQPRMVRAYHRGDRRAFLRDVGLLVLFGFAVLAVAVVGALLLGDLFIRLTLGEEYVNTALLVAVMTGAGAVTIQRSLSKAVEAAHRFTGYLIVDLLTAAGIALSAPFLVTALGVVGAAYSLTVGFTVGTAAMLVLLLRIVREMPHRPSADS